MIQNVKKKKGHTKSLGFRLMSENVIILFSTVHFQNQIACTTAVRKKISCQSLFWTLFDWTWQNAGSMSFNFHWEISKTVYWPHSSTGRLIRTTLIFVQQVDPPQTLAPTFSTNKTEQSFLDKSACRLTIRVTDAWETEPQKVTLYIM